MIILFESGRYKNYIEYEQVSISFLIIFPEKIFTALSEGFPVNM